MSLSSYLWFLSRTSTVTTQSWNQDFGNTQCYLLGHNRSVDHQACAFDFISCGGPQNVSPYTIHGANYISLEIKQNNLRNHQTYYPCPWFWFRLAGFLPCWERDSHSAIRVCSLRVCVGGCYVLCIFFPIFCLCEDFEFYCTDYWSPYSYIF